MKARSFSVAAGAIACSLATGAVALAAATPHADPIRMFFTYETPFKDKVLVTGAVADYGDAISENAAGKVDPNGNFEKVTLKHGGFIINATALPKAITKQFSKEPINPRNCSVALVGTGPSTVQTGTGRYTGITGSLKITLTIAGIAPKTRAGKCNLSNSAPLYGHFEGVTATGSVSFK